MSNPKNSEYKENTMSEFAGYHQHEPETGEYGSFEVFHNSQSNSDSPEVITSLNATLLGDMEKGWYWWACFPGCVPDSDAAGPFVSAHDAHHDAVKLTKEQRKALFKC
jgi:hypothetical protein